MEDVDVSRGFLYAFYHYSQSPKSSLIEKLVSLATSSDCVHVAIAPAIECHFDPKSNQVRQVNLLDKVYTAFMGKGFEIQSVQSILNGSYEYIPAYCTPGELKSILLKYPVSMSCKPQCISIKKF